MASQTSFGLLKNKKSRKRGDPDVGAVTEEPSSGRKPVERRSSTRLASAGKLLRNLRSTTQRSNEEPKSDNVDPASSTSGLERSRSNPAYHSEGKGLRKKTHWQSERELVKPKQPASPPERSHSFHDRRRYSYTHQQPKRDSSYENHPYHQQDDTEPVYENVRVLREEPVVPAISTYLTEENLIALELQRDRERRSNRKLTKDSGYETSQYAESDYANLAELLATESDDKPKTGLEPDLLKNLPNDEPIPVVPVDALTEERPETPSEEKPKETDEKMLKHLLKRRKRKSGDSSSSVESTSGLPNYGSEICRAPSCESVIAPASPTQNIGVINAKSTPNLNQDDAIDDVITMMDRSSPIAHNLTNTRSTPNLDIESMTKKSFYHYHNKSGAWSQREQCHTASCSSVDGLDKEDYVAHVRSSSYAMLSSGGALSPQHSRENSAYSDDEQQRYSTYDNLGNWTQSDPELLTESAAEVPTPPVRDSSSLKYTKYGPGHEKYPSWPVSAAATNQISGGPPHPVPTGGNFRSKSWTEQTDYVKEKPSPYARPYMKRSNQSYTQQLKTVMEKCEKINAETFESKFDEEKFLKHNMFPNCSNNFLPQYDHDGKLLGDKDYTVPSPPERDLSEMHSLTQTDLEEYAKKYDDVMHHYAQSEGYHSYISSESSCSLCSTSTPFLDQLRRDSFKWPEKEEGKLSPLQSGRESVVTSSSSNSSNETLKWHGSTSDLSILSGGSSSKWEVNKEQRIAHSARVQPPLRQNSESVLYYNNDNRKPPPSRPKQLHVTSATKMKAETKKEKHWIAHVEKHNNHNLHKLSTQHSYSIPKVDTSPTVDTSKPPSVAERIYELEKRSTTTTVEQDQTSYSYYDPEKKHRVSDPALKALQKRAVLSYYERHAGKPIPVEQPQQPTILPRDYYHDVKRMSELSKQRRLLETSAKCEQIEQYPLSRSSSHMSVHSKRSSTASDISTNSRPGSIARSQSMGEVIRQSDLEMDAPTSDCNRPSFLSKIPSVWPKQEMQPPEEPPRKMVQIPPERPPKKPHLKAAFHNKNSAQQPQQSSHSVPQSRSPPQVPPPQSRSPPQLVSHSVPQPLSTPQVSLPLAKSSQKLNSPPQPRSSQSSSQKSYAQPQVPPQKTHSPPPKPQWPPTSTEMELRRIEESATELRNIIRSNHHKPKLLLEIERCFTPELPLPPPPVAVEDVTPSDEPLPPPPDPNEVSLLLEEPIEEPTSPKTLPDSTPLTYHKDSYMAHRRERMGYEGRYRRTLSPTGIPASVASSNDVGQSVSPPTTPPTTLEVEKNGDTTLTPTAWERYHNIRSTGTTVIFNSEELLNLKTSCEENVENSQEEIEEKQISSVDTMKGDNEKSSPVSVNETHESVVVIRVNNTCDVSSQTETTSEEVSFNTNVETEIKSVDNDVNNINDDATGTDIDGGDDEDVLDEKPCKLQEEIECEELSRELVNHLPETDVKLQCLLVPGPEHKTTADYMKGLFELELEGGKQLARRVQSPSLHRKRMGSLRRNDSQRTNNRGDPLPSHSTYFTTSESKAKFLNRYVKDMNQQEQDGTCPGQEELTRKKNELVASIGRKLDILRSELLSIREEIKFNEELGSTVSKEVEKTAQRNEFEKFRLHIEEVDKITRLLLGLSGRLARAENAMMNLKETGDKEEERVLRSKRDKLVDQLEEAKRLKESIDRRSHVVAAFLHKYLDEEQYEDYDHFVKMKAKLIMDSREIDDKIKLGEEQLSALKDPMCH